MSEEFDQCDGRRVGDPDPRQRAPRHHTPHVGVERSGEWLELSGLAAQRVPPRDDLRLTVRVSEGDRLDELLADHLDDGDSEAALGIARESERGSSRYRASLLVSDRPCKYVGDLAHALILLASSVS